MRSIQWYADKEAELIHKLMQEGIAPTVGSIFPHHEFTHMGIKKVERWGELTGEVIVTLHLNPIGTVRVVPEREEITSPHNTLNNK